MGVLAMPRVRYITHVAQWFWPCPPPIPSRSPEWVAAAAPSGHLWDMGVMASLRFLTAILTLVPVHSLWHGLLF